MSILNEEIPLQQFNSDYTYKGNRLASFFRSGRAESRKLLPAGTPLWKCTSFGLLNPRGNITEWWVDGNLLAPARDACTRLHCTLQEFARARYAVSYDWNSMDNLLEARLIQPVYAFIGETRGVSSHFERDKSGNVTTTPLDNVRLIGGNAQYCIPNLTTAHIVEISSRSARA